MDWVQTLLILAALATGISVIPILDVWRRGLLKKAVNSKQPKRYRVEVRYLHCPPERRDACPIWKAGYDVATFKDEPPDHLEGCFPYREYLGPTWVSPADFTRAEWIKWLEKVEKEYYFCSNRDIIMAAVEAGEVEGAFVEDGKPYRWVEE